MVVARTDAGAAEVREQFEAERATADYALVLADSDIDVVHICTPNALHFPMARAALSAGKHVILEKPFTLTASEGSGSTGVSIRPWTGGTVGRGGTHRFVHSL